MPTPDYSHDPNSGASPQPGGTPIGPGLPDPSGPSSTAREERILCRFEQNRDLEWSWAVVRRGNNEELGRASETYEHLHDCQYGAQLVLGEERYGQIPLTFHSFSERFDGQRGQA